jgi:quinol monooxygenase YgiN
VSAPTTVIVVLTPLSSNTEAVANAMRAEIDEIRQADCCELYDMFERVDGAVILIERWRDREAWQAQFETPAIMRLQEALTPLLAKPAERWKMYPESSLG